MNRKYIIIVAILLAVSLNCESTESDFYTSLLHNDVKLLGRNASTYSDEEIELIVKQAFRQKDMSLLKRCLHILAAHKYFWDVYDKNADDILKGNIVCMLMRDDEMWPTYDKLFFIITKNKNIIKKLVNKYLDEESDSRSLLEEIVSSSDSASNAKGTEDPDYIFHGRPNPIVRRARLKLADQLEKAMAKLEKSAVPASQESAPQTGTKTTQPLIQTNGQQQPSPATGAALPQTAKSPAPPPSSPKYFLWALLAATFLLALRLIVRKKS